MHGTIETGFIGTHKGEARGPTVHDYLASADVYLSPCCLKNIVLFSGLGTTPTQATLVNTPVVGMSLLNFQGTSKERDKLGIIPKNKGEITNSIINILKNRKTFENSRQISKKYFSWERIMKKHSFVYDKLARDYYDKYP